jgi:hypothetical protein
LSHDGTGPRVRSVVLRLLATTVTGLSLAAVLAGCSSNKPSASPPSNASATTTTSTVPGPSTTLPPPTTSTTIPGCTGANYSLSELGSQGAAGTFEVTFGFRNTAAAACPLSGYPGIQLVGSGGALIPTTTVRGGTESFTDFAPSTVAVGPGATAYFNLAYSDVTTGTETSCPTATGLQAIPPNSTTSLSVSGQFQVCNNGTVTVSPVFGKNSPETQTTAPPRT